MRRMRRATYRRTDTKGPSRAQKGRGSGYVQDESMFVGVIVVGCGGYGVGVMVVQSSGHPQARVRGGDQAGVARPAYCSVADGGTGRCAHTAAPAVQTRSGTRNRRAKGRSWRSWTTPHSTRPEGSAGTPNRTPVSGSRTLRRPVEPGATGWWGDGPSTGRSRRVLRDAWRSRTCGIGTLSSMIDEHLRHTHLAGGLRGEIISGRRVPVRGDSAACPAGRDSGGLTPPFQPLRQRHSSLPGRR